MTLLFYAAYGSNLHPVRLLERVPSAELIGTGFVPGFSLRFNKLSNVDGSAKCSIDPGGTGTFHAVYRMPAEDKSLLDACEGLGNGYDELWLDLPEFGACFTYIAAATHMKTDLDPFDWYKAMVLRGCEFNRFPDDYIGRIRARPAISDPDPERRKAQWDIAGRLT